jgi:hypothetical protein
MFFSAGLSAQPNGTVAINTPVKQQDQRSGCLLLTLNQEDQAHSSKSKSFMVKSSRNNGGVDGS